MSRIHLDTFRFFRLFSIALVPAVIVVLAWTYLPPWWGIWNHGTVAPVKASPDWAQLSTKQFLSEFPRYLKRKPKSKDGRIALVNLWTRIDEDNGFVSEADPALLLISLEAFEKNLHWLRTSPGTYVHGPTSEFYTGRLAELRNQMRERFEESMEVRSRYTLQAVHLLWKSSEVPMEPDLRQPAFERRAQAVAAWMREFNWKLLSAKERQSLLRILIEGGLNPNAFSVRWSGRIVPPVDGEFRFGPHLHHIANAQCRVTIDDDVVFDSMTSAIETESADSVWLGRPVKLSANQSSRILVEYCYDAKALNKVEVAYSAGRDEIYPMMILMWESAKTGLQVVPEQVFRTPEAIPTSNDKGLWTEYFDRPQCDQPSIRQFLSPGICHIWTEAPVMPEHFDLVQDMTSDSLQKALLSLERTEEDSVDEWMAEVKWIFPSLQLRERQEFIWKLLQLPEKLETLSAQQFKPLHQGAAMLPGDSRLRLFTSWTQHHTSGPLKDIPSGRRNLYYSINHSAYESLGRLLSGHHERDLDLLMASDLIASDGAPKVESIAIVGYGLKAHYRGLDLLDWLQDRLNDSKDGNDRARWLIAHAWLEEVLAPRGPLELAGLPALEEALESAVDPALRFDILREIIVREATQDRIDQALELIRVGRDEFREVAQVRLLDDDENRVTRTQKYFESLSSNKRSAQNWGKISASNFRREFAAFERSRPSRSRSRTATTQLWQRFLAEDHQFASADLGTQIWLINTFQKRIDWVKNPNGSFPHGPDKDFYIRRLESLRERLRQQFEESEDIRTACSMSDFQRLWFHAPLSGEPEEREEMRQRKVLALQAWLKLQDKENWSGSEMATLLSWLTNDDLDRDRFAVRWTGRIVPPVDGNYRFGPLLHHLANGDSRIFINGHLVSDTSSPGQSVECSTSLGERVFLAAGEHTDLQVEYVYDMSRLTHAQVAFPISKSMVHPMMVLMWDTPETGVAVVPESAYRSRDDFDEADSAMEANMLVEFFQQPGFTEVPVAVDRASSIQEIWTRTPISPEYTDLAREIREAFLVRLHSLPPNDEDGTSILGNTLFEEGRRVLSYMRFNERLQVLKLFLAPTTTISDLDLNLLNESLSHLGMIPSESRLPLLRRWIETRHRASEQWIRLTSGQIDQTLDHDGLSEVSIHFVGYNKDDLKSIRKFVTEREKGTPDYELLAIAAHGSRLQNEDTEILHFVQNQISEDLSGDERAEWTAALAFVEEAYARRSDRYSKGIPHLEEAFASAESPELKLSALRELIARHISTDDASVALERLRLATHEIDSGSQRIMLNKLRTATYNSVASHAKNRPRNLTIAGWERLSSDSFLKEFRSFSKRNADQEQKRVVLSMLWKRFLLDEVRVKTMRPDVTMAYISEMEERLDWLRNSDGSYEHGSGPDIYTERIAEIREQLRREFETSEKVRTSYSLENIRSLWVPPSRSTRTQNDRAERHRLGQAVALWARQTNPKELSPRDRGRLLSYLSQGVNRDLLAVRWTGQLVAPVSGDFRLGPSLHRLANGQCKIIVNGKTIFDSEETPAILATTESVLLGDVIQLQAGQPVALQVDYQYDASKLAIANVAIPIYGPELYPMMILTWESPVIGLQVVPESAFRLPQNMSTTPKPGLWTEYFSDASFDAPPIGRAVTPAIQEIWTRAPILPDHTDIAQAIIDDGLQRALSSNLNDGRTIETMLTEIAPIFDSLRMPERQRILNWILSQQSELAVMPASRLSALMPHIDMLPGDARLQLLVSWAQFHRSGPVKRVRTARGRNLYNTINHFTYQSIGRRLCGHYQKDLDKLMEFELVSQDGEPQIELIAIASYGFLGQYRGMELRRWVHENFEQHPEGDSLAQWLVAKAWVEESFISEGSKGIRGLPSLRKALEVAVDPLLQMDILHEIVIRETTMGNGEQALQRIEEARRDRFPDPEQRDILDKFRRHIEEVIPAIKANDDLRQAQRLDLARTRQLTSLSRRIQRAQARGDQSAASRYQKQLEQSGQASKN